MTGDTKRLTWSNRELDSVERLVEQFKRIFIETLDQHPRSGLYTTKYHLLDHMFENMQ